MYADHTTGRTQSSDIEQTQRAAERAIFRDEARQHYIRNAQKVELPMVISPRSFVFLWIGSLLLMAVGLVIAFWPLIQQLGVRSS